VGYIGYLRPVCGVDRWRASRIGARRRQYPAQQQLPRRRPPVLCEGNPLHGGDPALVGPQRGLHRDPSAFSHWNDHDHGPRCAGHGEDARARGPSEARTAGSSSQPSRSPAPAGVRLAEADARSATSVRRCPRGAMGDLRSSEGRSDAIAEADEMAVHLLQIHTRFFRFPLELRLNKNLVRHLAMQMHFACRIDTVVMCKHF
jgi:hypothetical protein